MALVSIEKDYVNEKIVIYPFDEIDKKLEKEVVENNRKIDETYDIIHYSQFQKLLYSDFNKKLLPYVNKVLDEYEYDSSVVYDEYIDRHSIFLMVTRVMEHLRESEYFKDISENDFTEMMNKYTILRADAESMLLSELFYVRRLNYARENKLKKNEKVMTVNYKNSDSPIYVNDEFL